MAINYSGWGEELTKVVSKIGEVGFTAILLSYIVACWWNDMEPNTLAWAGLGVFGANFGVKKVTSILSSKTTPLPAATKVINVTPPSGAV
jgi:hypothetical protein